MGSHRRIGFKCYPAIVDIKLMLLFNDLVCLRVLLFTQIEEGKQDGKIQSNIRLNDTEH